jgi:hypothetical protein
VSKKDVGNYTCKAKNEFGVDSKKISVQVVGEITFIAAPRDKNTTRGSQIKLKCQAEGIITFIYLTLVYDKDILYQGFPNNPAGGTMFTAGYFV